MNLRRSFPNSNGIHIVVECTKLSCHKILNEHNILYVIVNLRRLDPANLMMKFSSFATSTEVAHMNMKQ